MMQGKGVLVAADGSRYEGDFVDDKREGKGELTWPDGSHYVGEFSNDHWKGKGVFTWPNGTRYQGDYVADKMKGKGVFIWTKIELTRDEHILHNVQITKMEPRVVMEEIVEQIPVQKPRPKKTVQWQDQSELEQVENFKLNDTPSGVGMDPIIIALEKRLLKAFEKSQKKFGKDVARDFINLHHMVVKLTK